MPRMPKWLADFSEKTFKAAYKQTVITEVEYYAPKLKRIRYQGDALRSIEWKPAQEVEFRLRQHLHTADSATAYFLSGNADTIKNLRRILVSTGVPGAQIRIKPYWLEGKKGL
jgi:NADPH-dependent ferric siderophore reductase